MMEVDTTNKSRQGHVDERYTEQCFTTGFT